MVNDKAAATYHPDGDLPPLSVVIEMLEDVRAQLQAVDELVVRHRRASRDNHKELERLQYASMRVGQAWTAVDLARRDLQGHA